MKGLRLDPCLLSIWGCVCIRQRACGSLGLGIGTLPDGLGAAVVTAASRCLLCSTVYTLYEPTMCVAAQHLAYFVLAAPHPHPCKWDSPLPVRVGDCKGCAMHLALGSLNICMKKPASAAEPLVCFCCFCHRLMMLNL